MHLPTVHGKGRMIHAVSHWECPTSLGQRIVRTAQAIKYLRDIAPQAAPEDDAEHDQGRVTQI